MLKKDQIFDSEIWRLYRGSALSPKTQKNLFLTEQICFVIFVKNLSVSRWLCPEKNPQIFPEPTPWTAWQKCVQKQHFEEILELLDKLDENINKKTAQRLDEAKQIFKPRAELRKKSRTIFHLHLLLEFEIANIHLKI